MILGCPEGGSSMEELPDSMSRVAASLPARKSDVGDGVDLFSQAMKVLTERSPNDNDLSVKDDGGCQGMPVLPAQLVGLLAKHIDSRRRHKNKKANSVLEGKKKSSSRQSRGLNIWIETEVYFRDLKLSDIETLSELSRFLTSDCMKIWSIPAIGNATVTNGVFSANSVTAASASPIGAEETSFSGNVDVRSDEEMASTRVHSDHVADTDRSCDVMVSVDVSCDTVAASGRSGEDMVPFHSVGDTCRSENEMISIGVQSDSCIPGTGSGNEMIISDEEVVNTETKKAIEHEAGNDACSVETKYSSPLSSARSSLNNEWVLGSKNKILLASERPSKKRKLLGENAGLKKLIVSQPCEGNPNLCHICSQGDNKSELSNRLIACSACGIAVHRKCYGVEEDDIVESGWFCSWCKHKNSYVEVSGTHVNVDSYPCLLCPKQGGALKPLKTKEAGNLASVKFAHLFCCQWMPEVFVEDTKRMEPIMNVDGIKETRKKLICSICKVKYGACVRCSNGTCRASFHPICAREASHRTEIWGKAGSSDVELRAFCSKHSDIPACSEHIHQVNYPSINVGETSQTAASSEALQNGHYESEVGRKCRDFCDAQMEIFNNSLKLNGELVDVDIQNGGFGMNWEPEKCRSEPTVCAEAVKNNGADSFKPSVALLLKKLIDQGKVNMKEVALEMGMLPDALVATVASDTLTADSQKKAISWLKSHAYLGGLEKNARTKIKSMDKLDKEALVMETQVNSNALELNAYCNQSTDDPIKKDFHDPTANSSVMAPNTNNTVTEDEKPFLPNDLWFNKEGRPYVHWSVYEKLMQLKNEIPFSADNGLDGCWLNEVASLDVSPRDGIFPNRDAKISACSSRELEQLSKAKALEICDTAPADELEGELVYFQHRLLGTKLKRNHFSDGLVSKAVKSLPSQIDVVRDQLWDSLFVNKYLSEVREAKKQGRKEKRHIEAQAVLAAANAAAASSSRISTLRKDDLDESSSHENPSKPSHMLRASSQSHLMPRPKEMRSRVAVPNNTPEKQDSFQSSSDVIKETIRSCDVCLRQETILNSILICSICKVSVHLDCYRSVKDFSGPWKCELCEDTISGSSQPIGQNPWEKHLRCTECVVCGGSAGAFRKSTDGQWIHAFCAEWTMQSTFKRGQIDPIGGLESMAKGNDACCVCRLKKGVCLKCHFGHCQSTFHPSCAKIAGFYMNNKSIGNKVLHKAYCEKHSSDQRAKDENQRHGTDELKSVKQVRVELERLRLLCERIVKREKLKRDLLLCSHDILASKRDSVAFSALLRSPYFHPGISSDSATTSLYNSGSEAIQKSDDVTVDSTSSVKKPQSHADSVDNDRKTDDSSTSQLVFARKHTRRVPFAGKKIPNRTLSISRNLSDDSANRLKIRKLPETIDKDRVTSTNLSPMKKPKITQALGLG